MPAGARMYITRLFSDELSACAPFAVQLDEIAVVETFHAVNISRHQTTSTTMRTALPWPTDPAVQKKRNTVFPLNMAAPPLFEITKCKILA